MKRYITKRVRHLRDIGYIRKCIQWFDTSNIRKINKQSSVGEKYNMNYVGNEYYYRFKLKDYYQRRKYLTQFNRSHYYLHNKNKISGYK